MNDKTNKPKSEVQEAAENINPSKLAENLHEQSTTNTSDNNESPENLADNEKTPFIDESLRTDEDK